MGLQSGCLCRGRGLGGRRGVRPRLKLGRGRWGSARGHPLGLEGSCGVGRKRAEGEREWRGWEARQTRCGAPPSPLAPSLSPSSTSCPAVPVLQEVCGGPWAPVRATPPGCGRGGPRVRPLLCSWTGPWTMGPWCPFERSMFQENWAEHVRAVPEPGSPAWCGHSREASGAISPRKPEHACGPGLWLWLTCACVWTRRGPKTPAGQGGRCQHRCHLCQTLSSRPTL